MFPIIPGSIIHSAQMVFMLQAAIIVYYLKLHNLYSVDNLNMYSSLTFAPFCNCILFAVHIKVTDA